MKKGWNVCFMWFVLSSSYSPLLCQKSPEDPLEILDNLSEESIELVQDQTGIMEQLQYLGRHPLDLNTIEPNDLELLQIFSPLEIKAIMKYRDQFGPFIDPLELQVIENIPLVKIREVLQYVTVNKTITINRDNDGYCLIRSASYFPRRKGFLSDNSEPTAYLGSPFNLLIKYRQYQGRKFSWGASMEKDAGEQFDFKNKPGFDHVHFHYFKADLPGRIKKIAIGDYKISLGQGLLQYQGFAITKSSNPLTIKRVYPVIQPYSGTSEYYYYRGLASEMVVTPQIRSYFFVHRKKRDATIRSDPDSNEPYFSAFQTSGLHRTANEEAKRNQVKETVAGHRLQWEKGAWKIGINSILQWFSIPYQPARRIDNVHRLTGSRLISHSVDYSGYFRSLHVFGEVATQNYRSPAFTMTGLYSFNSRLDGGLLIRRFPAYFAPTYGNAFSARSLPNNESGVYIGLNYFLGPFSRLSFFLDSWKGLWPTFQVQGPSFDQDLFMRYDVKRRREWEAYAQIKFKHRNDNRNNPFPVYNRVVNQNQISLRLQFRKINYQHWRWTNRIETNLLKPETGSKEYGILVFTDLFWSPLGSSWSLAARLACFNTQTYATRIYAYESDILYSFSIPSFYGKGWRAALRVTRKWRNGIRIELRTGWTFQPGKEEVGSGPNAVSGSLSQQAKVQVIYGF